MNCHPTPEQDPVPTVPTALVQCELAGTCEACEDCEHATPHPAHELCAPSRCPDLAEVVACRVVPVIKPEDGVL